jgi:hypothetical protein
VASFSNVQALILVNNAGSGWDMGSTINSCPQLESLELRSLYLNNEHLASIALPSLSKLRIDGETNDEDNHFVTDAGVRAIVTAYAGSLTSLAVCNLNGLTDEHVRAIGESCSSLQSLEIRQFLNYSCTDLGLVYISKGCLALRSIRVKFYHEDDEDPTPISDGGIMALRQLATDHHLTSVEIENSGHFRSFDYSPAIRAAFPPTCVLI